MWKMVKVMISLFLFGTAVSAWDTVRENSDRVTVFLQDALDNDRAEEIINNEAGMEEGEGSSVCFWQETSERTVYCNETGRSSQVQKLFVKGNAGLLFPEVELLTLSKHPEDCYLDTKTVRELFCTTTVEGQCIWQEEKSYTVRGTFEHEERLMICPAESEAAFAALILKFPDSGNIRGQAEQFLIRNGLTGDVVEFGFLTSMFQNLLLLYPVMAGSKLTGLLTKGRSRKGFLAAVSVLAAMIWMAVHLGSWPEDMIPTRWSEFSFWQNWWEIEKQNLILILRSPMGGVNLERLLWMGKTAIWAVTAILLL